MLGMNCRRLIQLSVMVWVITGMAVMAYEPALNLILPRGGTRGQELEIHLHGSRLNEPQELLFYQIILLKQDIPLPSNNPTKILEEGESTGTTRFFTGSNLEIARTNALPDALQRACEAMVSRLADGF